MERTLWTDERLDERMAVIDDNFDSLRTEMRAGFAEVKAEMRDLRGDFNRFQDRMVQVGFALVGVLLASLTTLAVTLVVAVA